MKGRLQIVKEALEEFRDTPTLTLSKMLYRDHPALWTSIEACRSQVRYYRSNCGEKSKKQVEFARENGKAGYSSALPKSIAKPNNDFKIPNGRAIIMSDAHFPYHSDEAMNVMLNYADKYEPNNLILNGDMVDFFAVSRWEKNPEERNLSKELHIARQFLSHLRERFPKARIIYKIGNHEHRWESYMWTKAPEICGVADFELRKLLDFAKYGVEEVCDKQKMKAGKHLTIIHGHEIPGAFAPVNFARTLQTNLGVCTIAGHRHQSSEHSFKTADDKFITCWSLGCLCDMRPDYAPINKWNHGFATLDLSGNDFFVDNKRIVNGQAV